MNKKQFTYDLSTSSQNMVQYAWMPAVFGTVAKCILPFAVVR